MKPLLLASAAAWFAIIAPSSSARENTRLDAGWRFMSGDIAGAEETAFDDTAWQAVALPHNWGWEEAQQGKSCYRCPG